MSDKRISELVNLTSLAADDEFVVVDADANATKRTTFDTLATEVRTESEPLSGTTGTFTGAITSNGNDVYHQGNILGTVSESSGIPTGAVIERSSNSNGEYVKFADGTMICTFNVNLFPLGASGQILRDGDYEWIYPVQFATTPTVSVSASPGLWTNEGDTLGGDTQTGNIMFAFNSSSDTPAWDETSAYVYYYFRMFRGRLDVAFSAIGQWY